MAESTGKSRADVATILVFGRALATAADALTPALIVRVLTKADVATFSALVLIHATVATMLSTGMTRALLYYLAHRPTEERRALTHRIISAQFLLSLFGAVLLGLVGWWKPTLVLGEVLPTSWLLLLCSYALLDMPTRLIPNLLVVENAARASAGMGLVRSIGLVAATLIPAAQGWGIGGMLAGHVAFSLLHVGLLALWVRHLYRGASVVPSPVSVREMVAFSWPLSATDIVGYLSTSLDRYLVLWLQPQARFAEYRAGAWQIPILTAIPYSIGAAETPHFAALFREGKGREVVEVWRGSIHKVSLIVTPVSLAFAAAGTPFIRLAFTPEYIDAVPVFQAYCFVTAMRVTAFGSVLIAAGETKQILRASALTLLTNAALSIPLAYWLGFVGPAIGAAVAIIPTFLYWSKSIADVAKVPLGKTFPWWQVGQVFLVSAPGVVAAQLLQHLTSLPDLALLPAQMLLTLVSAWGLGSLFGVVRAEDRAYAWRALRLRFLRKA